MNLSQSKLFSALILGVSSLFVGVVPNCFAQQGRRHWPLFISSLLCFGAGVLLATSVVHILPEVRESIPVQYKNYAEILFCCGFFILYIIDEIVHYFYGDSEEANLFHNHGHNHDHHRRQSQQLKSSYGTAERHNLLRADSAPYNPSFYRTRSDSVLFCDQPPSQLCHVGHQEPCHNAPTANFGLIVALSIHELLEGLVVGLETKPEKVLLLLGAVASHKLVISFCLGVELSSTPLISCTRHFIYILIFSVGSAAGIIAGMIVSDVPGGFKNVAMPILQALAGGTLLYVTVSEVLPRERARWHQQHGRKSAGVVQLLFVFLGFGLMTVLINYLD
ncbi:unnamed protein product [Diabrotica balteata]|uniref:Zinc transporter ZIP1 n=1 Tax=Diabrotica balteata TaxID=107213 RepID=A0A9P0DVJ4_DIABA|nr:unnamed protein product [Diabrotica balteata]